MHASGEVHVHHPIGERLPESFGMSVTLPGDDEAAHTVALRWTDPVQGFVGEMDATPVTGEATVLWVRNGRRSTATVDVSTLLPEAPNGGSVVAVGERVVEVLVESTGRAWLTVVDAEEPPSELDVTISIAGEDERLHPLPLAWNEEEDRFAGAIDGLDPVPGPLEVILEVDDTETVGRGTLRAIASPEPTDAVGAEEPGFRLDMPELGSQVPSVIPVGNEETAAP